MRKTLRTFSDTLKVLNEISYYCDQLSESSENTNNVQTIADFQSFTYICFNIFLRDSNSKSCSSIDFQIMQITKM